MKKLKKSFDSNIGCYEKGLVVSDDAPMQKVAEAPKHEDTPPSVQKWIQDATGSANAAFGQDLLVLCLDAASLRACPKEDRDLGLMELMKTLSCMNPQDEIEGMLCTKIIALHRLGMLALARIERSPHYDLMEMDVNMAAKLSRLENEAIEALNRHRRKGEQRVFVQHVNIEDGGKAIVQGGVIAGGGVCGEMGGQLHA